MELWNAYTSSFTNYQWVSEDKLAAMNKNELVTKRMLNYLNRLTQRLHR